MRFSSKRQTILALGLVTVLANCSLNRSNDDRREDGVSFLAFGDGGYNYNYIKKPRVTEQAYRHQEKAAWAASFKPPGEFQGVPTYAIPGTDFVIQKSGAMPVAKAMENHCKSHGCSFGIMLGDNIYPQGASGTDEDHDRFREIFEETYTGLGVGVPDFKLYAAFGNHDWKTSQAGMRAQLNYAKNLQTKVQMYGNGFYSFVRGNAEFFVLDTGLLLSAEVVYESKLNPDGGEVGHSDERIEHIQYPSGQESQQQLAWFADAIAESDAHWKIVYGHHPLWSSGGDKFEQAKVLRRLLMPTICAHADMYVAGHEHFLEAAEESCAQYSIEPGTPPVALIVSGAASKQRSIHSTYYQYLENTYPQFDGLWRKGMTWGFAHVALENDIAVVNFVSTPNSGSGAPVVEKTLAFSRRSTVN